jgi:ubiquinone/menaquinone biosynthesis C-methylase UbiE
MTQTAPSPTTANSLDAAKIEAQAGLVFGYFAGTMVSLGIWLGDQLGLYRAMSGAGPLTPGDLARMTALHERWLQEWLAHQASAKVVSHKDGTFELSPETAVILADESTPASGIGMFAFLPSLFTIAKDVPECFRTGLGRPYDAYGREVALGVQRATAATTSLFTDEAIPSLDGVVAKLESGAVVADIGCGAGARLIALAERYPRSEFHGYDISEFALEVASENVSKSGVENVRLHNPICEPLPSDGSLDLIVLGDVVHDLAHPDQVIGAARAALKPDGTMLVIDIAAAETLEENIAHPLGPLFFGISQLICLSSSLSEAGGAGIGTMGLSQSRLRGICESAGFTRFRTTDVADPMNTYYEIRP